MEYMLMFFETPDAFAARNHPDQTKADAYWGAWMAYGKALADSGISKSVGHALQAPATGTLVRQKNGQRHVHDGPFADSKEQLGGYMIIDVPTLDIALEWAARSPAASYGSVEVRPVQDTCACAASA